MLKKKLKFSRLHVTAVVTGYRRNMVRQIRHTSILRLEGVKERKDATFYLGKRVAYLTKSARNTKNSVHKSFQGRRVIWGKVIKTHGSSGCAGHLAQTIRRHAPVSENGYLHAAQSAVQR